ETPPEPIRIDFDGLMDRAVQVPVPPGALGALKAVDGKLHWVSFEPRGMVPWTPPDGDAEGEPRGGSLVTYDIGAQKLATLATGVLGYDVSMNGKVLVYRSRSGFTRLEAGAMSAPKPDKDGDADDTKISLAGWTIRIDPRAEWKQ